MLRSAEPEAISPAVRGGESKGSLSASPPGAPSVAEVVPPQSQEIEDHSDVIAAALDRIRAKAQQKGNRFKPYVAAKGQRAATPQGKQEVAKHLKAAAGLFREMQFEEAIEPLLNAIARDDEDRRAWVLLAEAYLRLGQPYKAAVGYLRALELSPKDEQAWLGLGRVLKVLDELPTAAAVLDRAAAIHPEHAETWAERGLIMESLQNFPEAARSFSKVLEIRPDHRVAQSKRKGLEAKLAVPKASDSTPAMAIAGPPAVAAGAASPPVETELQRDILDEMEDSLAKELPPRPTQAAVTTVPPTPSVRPARVRTFVEGLDEILEGGIPWGHVILLEGAPGTMKSSLGFSILLQNAARQGLRGLYLSLEERAAVLLKQMGSLGLTLDVKKGALVVVDPSTARNFFPEGMDWVDGLRKGILASIKEQGGLDLVAIDSLEALEVLAKVQDRRRDVYRLFECLRDLGITSFVITERPDWIVAGHVLQGRWDEDFLADGVLHLRIHMVSDLDAQRRLRVVKMRGTKHETGYLAMVVDDGHFRVTRAMSQ